MVPVVPPFAMYYTDGDGNRNRIKSISFHRKAAPALLAALNEIWDYCQHDQARVDASGASKYFGAYNHRMVRGSNTKWSNHAYAAAIDLNALQNALGVARGTMPQFIVDAFCRQGAMWGGWYRTRPDWMHFEFVDNGGRKPKSPPPVYSAPVALFDAAPAAIDEDCDHGGEGGCSHDEFEDEADVDEAAPSPAAGGGYSLDIEILQRKLLKLGYHELGEPDGGVGGTSKTYAVVTAFMRDRGKVSDGTVTSAVTAELGAALAEGWTRPIAAARAGATAKDIAPKFEAVRQNLLQRFWAKIVVWFGSAGAVASGASDQFSSVNEKLSPIKHFFASTPGWVWFVLIVLLAIIVVLSANKATQAQTRDYNTGRLN